MSLATKIAAGLCICPVVAAPPALMHKPTRDKIARAAGYVPKAQKPVSAPIAVNPEVACVEPSPSVPVVAMNDLGRQGPLSDLTFRPDNSPDPFFPIPPGGPVVPPREPPGSPPSPPGVIPGIPEPATWTVMVVGFGMVGAAVRRGGRTASPARRDQKSSAGA